MKRSLKSIAGVTLLEIMLVMAIASMVIIMSIRYYQSATSAQQVNSVLEQLQGVVAAADGLSQGSGSYTSGLTGSPSSVITPLLPKNGLIAPWGGAITFGATTPNTFSMTVNGTPAGVCGLLKAKLISNAHFGVATACSATAPTNLVVVYTGNL